MEKDEATRQAQGEKWSLEKIAEEKKRKEKKKQARAPIISLEQAMTE